MHPPVRHVLFDFGDTLAREPFCVIAPPRVPDWEAAVLAAYAEPGVLDRWQLGEMTFEEVASRVAARCGLDVAAARAAMEHDWRNLRFNRAVLDFAQSLGRAGRAAIVTVNPSIFSECIVPHYGLDRDFSVIVTSWQERTLDKAALCEIALDRLGAPGGLSTALLVDNRADNVEQFRARGGQGYRFTDDATFARDLPALRARLAADRVTDAAAPPPALRLRDVIVGDFAVFFEQQQDQAAARMAAFTSKDPTNRAAFDAHWKRLLGDATVVKKTILVRGRVAGHVMKFDADLGPEVTYWIGREHWGQGIATRALAGLLLEVSARPLFARAARDNVGSIRVLEKCGFRLTGSARFFANARGAEIDEVVLTLGA